MAGLFYSQYIPPGPLQSLPTPATIPKSQTGGQKKRKRGHDGLREHHAVATETGTVNPGNDASLNPKLTAEQEALPLENPISNPKKSRKHTKKEQNSKQLSNNASAEQKELLPEERLLDKYSVTQKRTREAGKRALKDTTTEENNDSENKRRGGENHPGKSISKLDATAAHSKRGQEKQKKRDKKKDKKEQLTEDEGEQRSADGLSQHPKLRSRYERSQATNALLKEDTEAAAGQSVSPNAAVHGLEPLPQPPIEEKNADIPTFSSLPLWMANPLRVTSNQREALADLGIESQIVANLQTHHIRSALPVQASIIPLLSPGPKHHVGDICVSAPTGSGKTLAYMVPMISELKMHSTTLLRAVIVVPTRELVAQASKVCEICASGSSVKIASATGSRAIKDEREALINKVLKHDPEEYQRTYEKELSPADWATFDLADLMESVDEEEHLPGYITHYESKVDILICTPGRLVDHVKTTKGFTLEHVNWFVVDEADKLLNESFQEWIEMVLPALHDHSTQSITEKVLSQMRLKLPPKKVQKIILSATMTDDLSQLNSLRLRNPTLVVVGEISKKGDENRNETDLKDENGTYHLPATLMESAVPVSDEAKKPLFLLELLKSQVVKPRSKPSFQIEEAKNPEDAQGAEDDSNSRTSSTDDETDVSSDTDSNSFSNTSITSDLETSVSKLPGTSATSKSALIFTRSSEAAARLSRLICLLEPRYTSILATLTRSSGSNVTSRKALALFKQKKISILIATDRASRGLDLPSLDHVISYDVPTSVTAYVHRVGRTARAGKDGRAWTLVAHKEGRWFWNEVGRGAQIVRSGKVIRFNVDASKVEGLEEKYSAALEKLEEEVRSKAQESSPKIQQKG
ncbi:MAG: hypothetical protein Q9227_003960 [Pyrenula ochraceoflavens]